MIRLPKHIFILIASLFLFSSVFAQKNKDKKKKGAESYTQEQIDKITAIQLDAEKAKLMEDTDEAIKKYRELFEIDNKNSNGVSLTTSSPVIRENLSLNSCSIDP